MTGKSARIIVAVLVGIGASIAARQIPLFAAGSNGSGCAVGHHSVPVGEHSHPVGDSSKPCPTPPGCAIGNGQSVGNSSKPCPTPPGCAFGNPRFVGDASKPCHAPTGNPPTGSVVKLFTGSGTSQGAGHFEFGVGCSFVHTFDDQMLTGQFIAEKVTVPVEKAALHDEQCVDAGPNFPGVGTFTITSSVGTLSGTFTTTGCGCDGPFSFPLVVTNGTGAYRGATGTIQLEGTLTFGVQSTFTETATFVANITRGGQKHGEPAPLTTPDASALVDRHCADPSVSQCSGPPDTHKPARGR